MHADSVLDAVGETPLVELDALRPDGGGRVLAKLEGGNPTGSMKDRMAGAGVRAARERGDLGPGDPVVEFTGGSTGSSLALVCTVLGHPLHIVTADCFSEGKVRTMRALGADVTVLGTPAGKVHPDLADDMRAEVDRIRDATGAWWFDQFRNEAAVRGYEALGREVARDAPEVTDLVAAVGTGGSAMGTARGLRDAGRDVRTTLVEPAESPYLTTGEGGSHGVEGVAVRPDPPLLDDALVDDVRAVPEADVRATAREAARRAGVLAGTSTGMTLAAAREVARERGPDAHVVAIAPDTGLKYLDGDLFEVAGRS